MIRFVLILVLIVICGLFIFPWMFKEYSKWDASNPEDDSSGLNKILLTLTPSASILDIKEAQSLTSGVVIDVRNQIEHDEGSIPDSILIPEQELFSRIQEEVPKKETLVYLYDNKGSNAAVAVRLLKSMGYERVYYLYGGIENWKKQNNPVNTIYFFAQ